MSTTIDSQVFTTADELPLARIVYTLVRQQGESGAEAPSLAYVVGGGLTQEIRTGFATTPADWWSQARDFFIDVVPTSSRDSFVRSLEDDDHPLPESAKRVRTLRQRSGLTWDQLARVFGVSRRSLHSWAQGGRMNAPNTERLAEVELVINANVQDDADATRDALFRGVDGGPSPFQQLLRGAHDRTPQLTPSPSAMLASSGEGGDVAPEEHWYENIIWPKPLEPSDEQTTEQ